MSILSRVNLEKPLPEPTLRHGQCFTHSKKCVCGYRAENQAEMDGHLTQMIKFGLRGHTRIAVTCRACHPIEQEEIENTEPEHACLCGECYAMLENLMEHIMQAQDQFTTAICYRLVWEDDEGKHKHWEQYTENRYVHGIARWREPSRKRIADILASIKSQEG